MARSRKDAWLRDELILALDLYRREGRNPSQASVDELSATLRAIPVEEHLASDPKFRNPAGVYLKIYNFVALDPEAETAGMSRGGRGDREVFDEYGGDSARLHRVADAIRRNLGAITPIEADTEEAEIADAPEGRVLTRVHRVRERNRRIVDKRKADALARDGTLACEACGFDFATAYGARGDGFIECHHTVPVSELQPHSRTKTTDLALVCANCHRMIHRRSPWLTLDELRNLVTHPASSLR